MGAVECDGEAFAETVVFLSYFEALPDPRQRGKVMYPLPEVLLLCLLAVLAGAETVTDIARFGEKKLEVLRRFRPFAKGTPAHDHLGDILATLDAEAFQRCFVAWVAALIGVPEGVVAIDGKTVRRSKSAAKDAIHVVSAFAVRQRLVMGQVKVADKANEIVAIPKLLDMLAIEGAVVTIDAMGCQRAIAQKIIDKKADYILALKGNQSSLREDVDLFVAEQKAKDFKDTTVSRHQTVDGDHGRIETRNITVIHDIAWLQERHQWPHLTSVIVVESLRLTPRLQPRDRQSRARNPFLHHLTGPRRLSPRRLRPRSLGRRKQPPLGSRHGLPRRRMPTANQSRPRKFHHPQTHGHQPHPKSQIQGFNPTPAKSRRMG